MNAAYLERLSQDLRELVYHIEQSSGVEIEVEVRAPDDQVLREQRQPLKCEMDQFGAKIIIPKPEHFPESSVLHELLHIRRVLVDKIPRLTFCEDYDPWSRQFETALTDLDNSLEHLIIVPEELKPRPERTEYWKKIMYRVFADIHSDRLPDKDRQRQALINTVFVSTVLSDAELANEASALLQQLGVMSRAETLLSLVGPALYSKERLAKIYVDQLRISIDPVCLEYIDTQQGTIREVQLALIGKCCPRPAASTGTPE